MPHLLISPSSTGPLQAPLPPAAFQAPVRILKRSSPSSQIPPPAGSGGSSSPSTQQKSLAEREARYQAARDRIFADSSCADEKAESGGGGGNGGVAVSVVRNPRGPVLSTVKGFSAPAAVSAGFKNRKQNGRSEPGEASPEQDCR